jgi:hypothetical protein
VILGLLGPDLLRTGNGRHCGHDDGTHLLGELAWVKRKRARGAGAIHFELILAR